MPAVSIVIPTLNEAENIHPLLTRVFAVAEKSGLAVEVVVVDDSSTDGTRDQVRQWQITHPVKLVCRDTKDGLASAVIEGARAARGKIVVVMDADLSHPPEVVPELVRPIVADTHDMVIGSRYVHGGATPGWPVSRKIASLLATVPARILVDPRDPLAGFFAVHRDHLAGLDESVSGFKIGLEALVAGAGNLRVTEIPITFFDRFKGKSKMNRGIIANYLSQLLTLIGIQPATSFTTGCLASFSVGCLLDFVVFLMLSHCGLLPGSAHIGSFLAASIATTAIHRRWTFPDGPLQWRQILGLLTVPLLVLFLRGGLLGDLLRLGCPITPAIIVTIITSMGATILSLTVFVFAGHNGRLSPDVRWRLFCVGVFVYSFVLRLVYLGLPALLEEEAYYWNYAQHPALSYLDHPPMVATLIRVGTFLFGNGEFGVRIGAVFCWLATAWFSCSLTRSLFSRAAAFRALFILSILPVFFSVGLVMTPDAPLTACWSGLLYFLHRALLLEKPRSWLGVGVLLGLGMISKYTIVFLGPAILLFILIDPRGRRWFISPWPYLAVLLALLIFSPVILWNFDHNWASFVFQGQRRVAGQVQFSTGILVGQILLLLTPTGFLALLAFFINGRGLQQSVFFKRTYLFFLLLILAPLTVFFIFSLTKEVKLNWTGPLWLALVPFIAVTITEDGEGSLVRLCRRLWPTTAIVMLLVSGLFLHYFSLGLPGVPILERPFLTGWDTFAGQIEKIVEAEEKKNGTRPLVVGMDKYQIASGLAYYRYKNAVSTKIKNPERVIGETLSSHIFGWSGLMYEYWFPPGTIDGKDLLLVSYSRDMIGDNYFQKYVETMEDIQELEMSKDGQTINHCFVRLVRRYHHNQ